MSNAGGEKLKSNLKACGLLDAAEEISDGMYRMTWGSATVVCIIRGTAVVAIAPMFEALPKKNVGDFCERILHLNSEMGGTASFAIQSDGTVVLQSGRSVTGLDPNELKLLLNTVGKFADDYDDILDKEFYQ
ncbi:MAG: YbjN domain-containing protein [Myxococcales bacterium]|nr:YbjN domain-containing protein [Myxococcales bacterium]